ncbi:MAG: family 2A encapsulin nanocompartment shell protein [Terrimicrobiaceae bacterium]
MSTNNTLSLGPVAARNLSTATVTIPQWEYITPRWFLHLLPYVNVDGGAYRVNQVKERKGKHGGTLPELATVGGGATPLPTTFVDYEDDAREYELSAITTVLHTHARITDLYNNQIDQLREQVRLTVEAVKEREESEILNHPEFGLLKEIDKTQRISTRKGPPTPDDLDELLTLVWKKPAFFLAHPRAIAAFGREATRRGVPPVVVNIFGSPFITWRGVPLIPSSKLPIGEGDKTSIILLRVGENQRGVVGLQKVGVSGEIEPGLSVRYSGTSDNAIASHLVTRYFSVAVLARDAIASLDNVVLGNYHEYV